MRYFCEICGDEYFPSKNRKIYGYCGKKCESKWRWKNKKKEIQGWSHNYWIKNQDKIQKSNKEYWSKNKERFKEVRNGIQKRWYDKNPRRSIEVQWVQTHRKQILNIIGNKCIKCIELGKSGKCDKIHIHHKTYLKDKLSHKNLDEYCNQLVPLCREHHNKLHQQLKANL